MGEIDWNTELRKIEREYDGLPPEPSAAEVRAQRAAERRAREESEARRARFGAAARLLLVSSLLSALRWWPYATRCGPGLLALVAAECMIVVGSVWVAVHTFRYRLAVSHSLAFVYLLVGLTLVAAEVLPRLGYVTIRGMDATAWSCAATDASRAAAPSTTSAAANPSP